MHSLFSDLLYLFYPDLCVSCSDALMRNENCLCTSCHIGLPRTDFHLKPGNPAERQFWGKIPVRAATALWFFNKHSGVQQFIHRLKYHGETKAGLLAGRMLGDSMLDSGRFGTIDAIIPVPLHTSRLRLRGYNQAELIGKGISEAMGIPLLSDFLQRNAFSGSQTRLNRLDRHEHVSGLFTLSPNYSGVTGHFLLADDVITTGATLAACAESIVSLPNNSVSMAAVAYARPY